MTAVWGEVAFYLHPAESSPALRQCLDPALMGFAPLYPSYESEVALQGSHVTRRMRLEPVFNAAMARQPVFQLPRAGRVGMAA